MKNISFNIHTTVHISKTNMKNISFNIRTTCNISKTKDYWSYMSMSVLNEKDESVTQYFIELYSIESGWYKSTDKNNIIERSCVGKHTK